MADPIFCSRCASRITLGYEPGVCFAADCEPTTSSTHDEAQTMTETFGDDPAAFAELIGWSLRDNDRYIRVTRLPGLNPDGEPIGGRWTVRIEAEDVSWSHEADGYDELSRAISDSLKAAKEAGLA